MYIRHGYGLQIVLGGAVTTNELQWSIDYERENTADPTDSNAGKNTANGTTAGTTPVTMLAKMDNGTAIVRHVQIYNADTAPQDVTVRRYDGVPAFYGFTLTVASGGFLFYDEGAGWSTLNGPSVGEQSMGEISVYNNATATVITTGSTWTRFSAVATTLNVDMEFDSPSNGRLRYTGASTQHIHFGCTLSIKSAGANDVIRAVLVKNGTVNGNNEYSTGTVLLQGQTTQKLGATGDTASTAIHTIVEMAQNDYLELFIQNSSSTNDLTVTDLNIFAVAPVITGVSGGGGGGDSITIKTVAVTDADFNDTSPAAPAGDMNVKWQRTGTGPDSVSAYVDVSVLEPLLTLSSLGGTLSVAKGGTGQTTANAAFNALSPVTTRGDIIVRDATVNARLAIGVANRVLRSDGTDPSWAQVALTTDVTGALPLANGGTGNTSKGPAFDALSPLSSNGDILQFAGGANARLAVGTAYQRLRVNSGATAVEWATETVTLTFTIDGGGSAITTGEKGHMEIPFAGTITGWTILGDQTGSIVVDVWKDTYAAFPPTVADTIAGTEKPTLSAAQKNQDLTLSTWTTAVTAGDILAFNVDSASTVTRVSISIRFNKQ